MGRWGLGQARDRRDVAETGKSDDSSKGDSVKSPIRVITAAAIFDGHDAAGVLKMLLKQPYRKMPIS